MSRRSLGLGVVCLILAAPAAAQVTNVDTAEGFASIQAAIDDADTVAGHTVEVDGGTYAEDVEVDKGITLSATTLPDGANPAVIDGLVEIAADGVVLEGFRIAPTTVYTDDVSSGAGVLVLQASDVTVRDNVIVGLRGDASVDTSSSMGLHGVQVWSCDAAGDGNITVEGNRIEDLDNQGDSNTWPLYGGGVGVKVQGNLFDVDVLDNHIRGIHSAGWAFGITVTGTGSCPEAPQSVTVEGNHVERVNDGSVYPVTPNAAPFSGVAMEVDDQPGADAGQVTVTCNNLLASPLGLLNKEDETLSAENNWWGAPDGPSGSGPGSGTATEGPAVVVPFLAVPIEQEPLCGGVAAPVTAVPALSPAGLAALIGLLVMASGALLRRTG